ncbi:MAG: hypothetical protein JO085_04730 [Acidimicrobiia bacterium]|nr:hypothetical protein [Acidimicrobiia bacterium]MBV8296122.1 hypothetical protein [Acidimicrobiia bacterium]
MDEREMARWLAIARINVGASLFAFPGLAGGMWVGRDAKSAGVRAVSRGFGVRDAIIGVGLHRALDNGDRGDIRRWLLFGAAADGADLVGTLTSWRGLPPVRRVLVLAGIVGFGGLGAWLSSQFA